MFIDWGLELEDAQEIADALTDWVDADDDVALNGAEKDDYEKAGRINQPFNRPFYDLSEVRLVRGMDLVEAVRPDWRNWFTIWSGGALDLNEAPAELIAAAAEMPGRAGRHHPRNRPRHRRPARHRRRRSFSKCRRRA